ncbi:hypothetical protein, partial [Siminovitchia sp. 179-K 8D1 HS]|uniref:hypothetical protein n=1 Tax=Siminovitchia sp. 179-K 8D1 HS TaxID=3142385 RepID=UPI0039A38513
IEYSEICLLKLEVHCHRPLKACFLFVGIYEKREHRKKLVKRIILTKEAVKVIITFVAQG